jgi:hypothetical protein
LYKPAGESAYSGEELREFAVPESANFLDGASAKPCILTGVLIAPRLDLHELAWISPKDL